jgi:hypothetical protein
MLAGDDVAAGILAGCGVPDLTVSVGDGSGVAVTILSGGRGAARAVHVATGVLCGRAAALDRAVLKFGTGERKLSAVLQDAASLETDFGIANRMDFGRRVAIAAAEDGANAATSSRGLKGLGR